jgi:hypothetical protein
VWYVACELVRQKIDDDTIFSVLTDPDFGISAHILDQPNAGKYALRQIEKAKESAIDPDLQHLNDRYMVIKNYGGKCVVAEEIEDDVLGRSTLSTMSYDQFKLAYANQKKDMGPDNDPIPLAMWWFHHPERKEFERVVFHPNRDSSDCYNLWRGFGVEARPGDCSLFLNHIREVLCKGNEAHSDYLIKWMAHAVQHPEIPGQVAIVMKGRQGTGKSFFARIFGRLFGRHYLGITDSRRLVGNFNAHLRDCVLLFADEAFYAGDKKHESNLKGLITESGLAIEAKGRDIEYQRNCLHVIMASNEDWAVPAGLDDRRFFILDVSNDQRNQRKHFAAIEQQMDGGGYSALLDYLLKVDLSEFEVQGRPETEALKKEKLNSMDPVTAWWFERLLDGEISFPENTKTSWPTQPVPKQQLYSEIRRNLSPQAQGRYSNNRLTRMLRDLAGPDLMERRCHGTLTWKNHQGTEYTATNPRGWLLPDLATARKWWEETHGQLAPWLDVSDSAPLPNDGLDEHGRPLY